jgi:ABC-2 type transport system ATP-binding protein
MRGSVTVTEAIRAEGLVKTFGSTRALDGLDLTVHTGEVHGFLGPNGAGKTTTIRILLGLMRANAGTARLLRGDPWRDATGLHRRLAYVPGDVMLWPNLSGGEVIDLLGRLRGGLDQQRRTELLERFDLDPGKKSQAYSKGNRQKVALIAALASTAELLLLDEPTAGLDPLMEDVFRQVIREDQRDRGRTVLLSSHILAEVEALCDRVSIIRDGRAREAGTLTDLRDLARTTIQAELSGPPTGLAGLPGVHDLQTQDSRVRFDLDANALDATLRLLAEPVCAAWSASRPPWRSCSCGSTTGPVRQVAHMWRCRRNDRHRQADPPDPEAGPADDAAVDWIPLPRPDQLPVLAPEGICHGGGTSAVRRQRGVRRALWTAVRLQPRRVRDLASRVHARHRRADQPDHRHQAHPC